MSNRLAAARTCRRAAEGGAYARGGDGTVAAVATAAGKGLATAAAVGSANGGE